MNLLLHGFMHIPSDEQHSKVHGRHGENEMEKTITIWNVVFRLCFSLLELHLYDESR